MKKTFALLFSIAVLLAGCERYDHAIQDLNDRIEMLEGASIASVEQQIAAINSSLDDLEAVDVAIEALIKNLQTEAADLQQQLEANATADAATKQALEAEIEALKALIVDLQAKDADLDQQIAGLQTYVDTEIDATEDWAEATFATLTQYEGVQTEMAAVKALIEQNKTDITAAYTEAIATAIANSEASMKQWVNETLAQGYYDIATIDGKLAALDTKVDSVDSALSDSIAAQKSLLAATKSELTAAYTEAITTAIEDNNGVIDAAIAKAVQDALATVDAKLATITDAIAGLQSQIDVINSTIATIEQQITNITASIADLEEVDEALKALIESLQAEAADLQSQLDANSAADAATKQALETEIATLNTLITALQAKDAELEQQIAALKSYVDTEIGATEDWAEATFATLAQYTAMQTELATLTALIETYKQELTDDYTAAIDEAVADMQTDLTALEASMKQWVNEILAQGYYDVATIDGKLAALQATLDALAANGATDQELADAITAQQAALNAAKSELTAAYQQAIAEAINNNNGVIDTKIANAIATAKAELQNQIDAINTEIATIKGRLTALEGKVADLIARIQSIRFMPEYSDGMVELLADNAPVTLTFLLSPSAAAQAVATAYESNNSVVTAYLSRTQSRTRAVDAPIAINVTDVTGTADGMLTVEVNTENLPADYWAAAENANLFIRISDGNNEVISEMIQAYYYAPYVTFASANVQTLSTVAYDYSSSWWNPTKKNVCVENLEYSVGEGDWQALGNGATKFGGAYGNLRLRGKCANGTGTQTDYVMISLSGSEVICSGDIRTLIDYENYATTSTANARFYGLFEGCTALTDASGLQLISNNDEMAEGCYRNMFDGCTSLTAAPVLPATTLAQSCYNWMFQGCTSLTVAPELPATTLADYCYNNMFGGCTGLTAAPALPATTLAQSCYSYMFAGCTGLTTAPELPATTLAESCYSSMFEDCTSLTNAPELPATTLAEGCYESMFYGCTNLAAAPELTATTLAGNCYNSMFRGCTGLTEAPALPATTLAESCYNSMFYDCTNLAAAPELTATTLAGNCYNSMFYGCTNLAAAPELPATTLAEYCYSSMFYGCTSLTDAPELPATTLAQRCYSSMFEDCTSLTAAPELPATTLADGCYTYMFSGCTSLTDAPELPATTLAQSCYSSMFAECSSLTSAPELPATTLQKSCYCYMFRDCTNLTASPVLPALVLTEWCYTEMFERCTKLSTITMYATDISANNCLNYWVKDVPGGGTFYMNSNATWNRTGSNGIPSGWTRQKVEVQ